MYLDRFNLKGRVAVVTDGGQGIGLAGLSSATVRPGPGAAGAAAGATGQRVSVGMSR